MVLSHVLDVCVMSADEDPLTTKNSQRPNPIGPSIFINAFELNELQYKLLSCGNDLLLLSRNSLDMEIDHVRLLDNVHSLF